MTRDARGPLEAIFPPLDARIVEALSLSPRAHTLASLAEATQRPAPKVWEAVMHLEESGIVSTRSREPEGRGRPAKEVLLREGAAWQLADQLDQHAKQARSLAASLRRRARRPHA